MHDTIETTTTFARPLNSLVAWVARHKDGSVVKYILDVPSREKVEALIKNGTVRRTPTALVPTGSSYVPGSNYHLTAPNSYGKLCAHDGDEPTFDYEGIKLFVADATGVRKADPAKYDLFIDAGGVLTDFAVRPLVYGEAESVAIMTPHVVKQVARPVLKMDWVDRGAPPVYPKAWIDLAAYIKAKGLKKICANCQGGHGRSGTAVVALMMALTNYTPLDAITHLRAMHCARAIESKTQHEYLNWLAEELGREQNALEAEAITDFRARFLSLTHPWGEEARVRLMLKGAKYVKAD